MSKYYTSIKSKGIENLNDFSPSSVSLNVGNYEFAVSTNMGKDTSGYSRTATNNGVTQSTNISDGTKNREAVANFSSGSKSLVLNTFASNFTYSSLSVVFWFKIASLGSVTILTIDSGTTANYFQISGNSNKLRFKIVTNSITNIDASSVNTYTDNLWHNAVIILSTSGNIFYIDNVQLSSPGSMTYTTGSSATTTSLSNFASTASRINIGSVPSGFTGTDYTGYIDNFTFFSKVLNGTEIGEIYNESSDVVSTVTSDKIINRSGNAVNPSYTFLDDTNTGLFLNAVGNLSFSATGVFGFNISSSSLTSYVNNVLNGTGSSTGSSATLYSNPASTIFSSSNNYFFNYFNTPTSTGSTTGTASTIYIAGAPSNATTAYALNIASGNSLFGGKIYLPSGSVSLPSMSFSSDPTTGIYTNGAPATISLSCGGNNIANHQNGTSVFYNIIQGPQGDANDPGISFSADSNTGLYNIGSDNIGITAGGIKQLDISTTAVSFTNHILVPTGNISFPSISFSDEPNTGICQPSTNSIALSANSTISLAFDFNIIPRGTTTGWSSYWLAYSPTLNMIVAPFFVRTTINGGLTWVDTAKVAVQGTGIVWADELGIFVIVSDTVISGVYAYTFNGTTFTNATTNVAGSWGGVAYSPYLNLFVSMDYAAGSALAMTSSNGLVWSAVTTADITNQEFWAIDWSPTLGIFVAVAYTSSNTNIMTFNGTTWTVITSPITASLWNIKWIASLSLFVIVGTNVVLTSTTGTSWISRTCPSYDWINITFMENNGLIIVNSLLTSKIMYSSDGITWALATTNYAGLSNTWGIIYDPDNGTIIMQSQTPTDNTIIATPTITGRGIVILSDDKLTSNVPLLASHGSVSLPSLSFLADPNTGIYNIGANNLGISCNGVKQIDISTSAVTFTNSISSTSITSSSTTATTSSTTGALIVSGGVGVAKNLWLGSSFSNTVNGLNGAVFNIPILTFTDSSTAVSGTATTNNIWSIIQPTIAATNATVTTTRASTMYLGGAPIKGTNETFTSTYGLYIDSAATTAATVTEAASLYIANAPTVVGGTAYSLKVAAGNSIFDASTAATSSTIGSLIISGGIGIAKNMWIGSAFTGTNTSVSGSILNIPAFTYTTSTSTPTNVNITTINQVTISNATAIINAASFYIANAPTITGGGSITNAYALQVASGNVLINASTTSTSSATGALVITGGVGIGGDLFIAGNFTIGGTTTNVNTVNLSVTDPLIGLATNNSSDVVDIGFWGKYVSSGTKYAGLIRKTATSDFYLFSGITDDLSSAVVVTNAATNVANLNANLFKAALGSSTVPTHTFSSDLTSGMSNLGSTTLAFITNNVQRLSISTTAISVASTITTSTFNATTSSTTAATGAVVISGGLGVAGNINFNGNITSRSNGAYNFVGAATVGATGTVGNNTSIPNIGGGAISNGLVWTGSNGVNDSSIYTESRGGIDNQNMFLFRLINNSVQSGNLVFKVGQNAVANTKGSAVVSIYGESISQRLSLDPSGTSTGSELGIGGITTAVSGAPGNTGYFFRLYAGTATDSSTATSGTATSATFMSIAQPTLAATNATVTTTAATTFYIAGAPTTGTNQTITNAYALQIATGKTLIAGALQFTGATPTNGYILSTDASGNASWVTPSSIVSSSTFSDGSSSLPGIAFTSQTSTGIYRTAAPLLGFSVAGTSYATIASSAFTVTSSNLTISATSNQLIFGTTNTVTISSTAPAASRTYTIPDTLANSSFVMTDLAQTINGSKTFSAVTSITNSNASTSSSTGALQCTGGAYFGDNSLMLTQLSIGIATSTTPTLILNAITSGTASKISFQNAGTDKGVINYNNNTNVMTIQANASTQLLINGGASGNPQVQLGNVAPSSSSTSTITRKGSSSYYSQYVSSAVSATAFVFTFTLSAAVTSNWSSSMFKANISTSNSANNTTWCHYRRIAGIMLKQPSATAGSITVVEDNENRITADASSISIAFACPTATTFTVTITTPTLASGTFFANLELELHGTLFLTAVSQA